MIAFTNRDIDEVNDLNADHFIGKQIAMVMTPFYIVLPHAELRAFYRPPAELRRFLMDKSHPLNKDFMLNPVKYNNALSTAYKVNGQIYHRIIKSIKLFVKSVRTACLIL